MPPLRTTTPTLSNKTERSHAENQERAYIAASRRSDRSLEARVESALRASEIHKRRTGRSLRVTEQDVLNEEMYEEEDDLLHYQRLAAHLHTGSAHLNARLAAFLTNQVAMRSAMASVHQNAHTYQYPPSPQHHAGAFQSSTFHSPEPLCSHIPHSSTPYPSAPFQAMPRPHHTTPPSSHPNPTTTPLATHQPIYCRPMSTPAVVSQNASAPSHLQSQTSRCDPAYGSQAQLANFPPQSQYHPAFLHHISPFNTTLSPEAQQIVGPALDEADPFQASLMHGSDNYDPSPNSNYSWGIDPAASVNGMPIHVHRSAPKKSSSTTLTPSPLAATSTTLAANSDDTHKHNSTPPSDFDIDNNNCSQEINNALFISSACPQYAPPQTQSSSSMPPKSFLSNDTTAATHSGPLDSDQNLHGPDSFWDHFLYDATWYHHDDLVIAATATAT